VTDKLSKEEIRHILSLVEPGEPIPIAAFFIRLEEPTEEDMKWARTLLADQCHTQLHTK
jgi:hypothetical protein